ncbi:unnamed protein product [Schistosoma mattheei]|uniref:Uncharacterized protein n=1 Tax=Schistosoma mattheei TaxID=31246 RepID=A0A183NQJ0_9TREM|nr:unnamed protein product [Schistosoma mattheei]
MMHLSCEETLKSCHGSIVEMLNRNITALDLRQDKACFFKRNEQVYTRPGYFKFMPSKEDIVSVYVIYIVVFRLTLHVIDFDNDHW